MSEESSGTDIAGFIDALKWFIGRVPLRIYARPAWILTSRSAGTEKRPDKDHLQEIGYI